MQQASSFTKQQSSPYATETFNPPARQSPALSHLQERRLAALFTRFTPIFSRFFATARSKNAHFIEVFSGTLGGCLPPQPLSSPEYFSWYGYIQQSTFSVRSKQKQMKSKQFPSEVYVLRKRVNLSSESSQPTQKWGQNQARLNYAERQGGKRSITILRRDSQPNPYG